MGKEFARRTHLIVLASLLLLTACRPGQSPVLSDQCNPPCWRGIEPGKAHTPEVLKLANEFPDLGPEGIHTTKGSWYIFSSYTEFKLRSGDTVDIYMLNDVVALMLFSNVKGIAPLGSCIAAFGRPEYAAQSEILGPGLPFLPASDQYHTWFFGLSPSKGIAFGYDTHNAWLGSNSDLSPNTMISDIRFFDVQEYEELLGNGFLVYSEKGLSKDMLHPWKGYGNIHELYPAQ